VTVHIKSFLSLLLVFPMPIMASAQPDSCTISLSGRVIDEHDAEALSFAEVFIPSLGKGSVADEHGRYRIDGLCMGTYVVRVAHLGCEPITSEVRVTKDLVVDFRLEHHVEELKELEVIQSRPDENVGHARQALGREAMVRAGGQSIAEMLVALPGVTLLTSGPSIAKPVIHGLSGNRILTLNQGIRQEDQQWGTDHAPSIDPLSSDRLTVVKGAASVQYGSDAIGGVVIAEPVELPRRPGLSGELRGIGILNGKGGGGSAMLQGGVPGLSGLGWRVQGSGRAVGDGEAARYDLSNTGAREWAASASIGFRDHRRSAALYFSRFEREIGILRAAHIGSTTDLQRAIESGVPWYVQDFSYAIDAPRQTVTHHLLKASAGIALTDRNRLDATYAYQGNARQEYDIRRGGRSARPSLDLFLGTHTGELILKHWLGPHVHGKAGLTGLLQENYNVPGTGVRPLLPDYTRWNAGAFVLEHFPFGERLELEAGARAEATAIDVGLGTGDSPNRRYDFFNHALSAGANWQPRDSLRLRFNVSSAYRPPHVSELHSQGLHHSAAAIEEGDASLSSERALKAVLDASAATRNGKLRIDATLHAARIDDYIYQRPDGTRLTIRGAFPVFRYTATDAVISGADLSVQARLGKGFTAVLKGSTVHGRDMVQGDWLFLMPGDRMEFNLRKQVMPIGRWSELEAVVSSLVVLKQLRYQADLDFSDPPADYHVLSATLSAARRMGKHELRIGMRGSNLLNAAYRDYLDRFRYYADARGIDIQLWLAFTFGNN
jgi:iron complex outermembrane receptor protein